MGILDAGEASCPQVAELWRQLRERLRGAEDLVVSDVWHEEQEASSLCKKERGRYLELQALLGGVEAMLSDSHRAARVAAEEQEDLRAVMEGQSLWCSPEVYRSIEKTLVAAQAAQRTELPTSSAALPACHSGTAHSSTTLLGLRAADVSPSTTLRQSVAAIPELERRLAQQCKWLEDVAGNTGQLVEDLGFEATRDGQSLPGLIRARLDSLSQAQRDEATACANAAKLFSSCFAELGRAQSNICRLIEQHHLDRSPGFVRVQIDQLEAHCKTLLSKLETMQSQFLYKTYTADAVRALSTVAGHIEGRQKEIQERLGQVRSRLAVYQEHQEELHAIAEEHKALQDDISEAEFALRQLESLEL